MLKICNYKVFGCSLFQGRPQNTHIATINIYLLIEIRHNILIAMSLELYRVEKIQLYA